MLCLVFSVCVLTAMACTNGEKITASPGETVTLLSSTEPSDLSLTSVECRKNNLGTFLLYTNSQMMPEYSHPHSSGRVDVRSQGSLSVVLKNVNLQDAGEYTCELFQIEDDTVRPLRVYSTSLSVTEAKLPGHWFNFVIIIFPVCLGFAAFSQCFWSCLETFGMFSTNLCQRNDKELVPDDQDPNCV